MERMNIKSNIQEARNENLYIRRSQKLIRISKHYEKIWDLYFKLKSSKNIMLIFQPAFLKHSTVSIIFVVYLSSQGNLTSKHQQQKENGFRFHSAQNEIAKTYYCLYSWLAINSLDLSLTWPNNLFVIDQLRHKLSLPKYTTVA